MHGATLAGPQDPQSFQLQVKTEAETWWGGGGGGGGGEGGWGRD